MCRREREIGGGTGVLLHENSVQKRFKEKMGQVSYITPGGSGWRESGRWRARMEGVSVVEELIGFILYVVTGAEVAI